MPIASRASRRHVAPWRRAAATLAAGASLTATALLTPVPLAAQRPPQETYAGEYRIVHWTTEQGLPQNSVNDVERLPNGDLWVATFGGLARFDGERFHVMDMATDAGLPTHRIVSLAAAGPDTLWFLTQQGHLGRVHRGVPSAVQPAASPPTDALDFVVDRAGRLFFKSVHGGLWQTNATAPWQRRTDRADRLQALEESEDGRLWAVWGPRLVDVTGEPRDAQVKVPEQEVAAFRRRGGGLWIAMGRDLALFAGGTLAPLRVDPAFASRVTAVASADGESLWVAAGHDVSRLDRRPDGSWRRRSLPLGLAPQVPVRTLRVDAEGSLWIGTDGGGLYRVNRPPASRVAVDAGLAPVSGLAPDGRHGAFVVSGCRGVYHVDASDAVTPVVLRDPADEQRVTGGGCGIALAPAGGGAVWVRAGPHVFRVTARPQTVTRVRVAVPHDEGPIVAAPGGRVWVVSRQGSLHLLNGDGHVVRQVSLPSPLMSATVAANGDVWVGGDGRVFRVRGSTLLDALGPADGVPRGLVRDVLVDGDGTAWFGTYGGGLGRWRDGRTVHLGVAHGLPDNSVTRLLDDGRGRIYVSTNRGVAVCERSQLDDVADGRRRALEPVVFGLERGVGEANFGSPAGFADSRGVLWFGTIDGAVRIDSAAFPFNSTPPVVRIGGVWAGDRALPAAPVVSVPALTARVRVDLAAPNSIYPELIRFRFRVEGVDDDWVNVGSQRSVTWMPPGPGRHRIAFQARNEDGVWSTTATVVDLDVQAAWWQTTGARTAAVVGVVLLAFGAYRWRLRSIERRHATALRHLEERRLADERLASLREQLEHVSRVALVGELGASLAHEIGQPIGAMVNNAEAGRRHLPKYLQRPGDLEAIFGDIVADGMRASEIVRGIRGLLRPQAASWSLVDLSDVVREMLPLIRRAFRDQGVDVALDLASDLPNVHGVRVQLGQVVVNLAMNACEALQGATGPRVVTLGTSARDRRVELHVIDTGPGPRADVEARIFEPFVTTKQEGLGMGLAICRSIAEAHGGHLAADRPAAGGFRVVLSLPAADTAGLSS